MSSGEKHTGPVTVRSDNNGRGFEFKRPNGEIFEMAFSPEYLGPKIAKGDELSDLTYADEKNHLAFFVKATLVKEFVPLPPAEKMLYEATSYVCGASTSYYGISGTTTVQNSCMQDSSKAYYRWKDGGYRDKPEPTKSK